MTAFLPDKKIAVVYLARGADLGWQSDFKRFITSYTNYDSGVKHRLYVIFKGFQSKNDFACAKNAFASIPNSPLFMDDEGFDISAYITAANEVTEDWICFLNTNSYILCDHWLAKLGINLSQPQIGLVGATGSFERIKIKGLDFPKYPNIHIRSNGFLVDRELFCAINQDVQIRDKNEAYLFESGHDSLSKRILNEGLKFLVVGRNGRGYSPRWWPFSDTFRQGQQNNLLIGDNQTEAFSAMSYSHRVATFQRTWGKLGQPKSFRRIL